MGKTLFRILLILGLLLSLSVEANNSLNFRIAKTSVSPEMNGQIDWPNGKIENFEGVVFVFISSGNPADRDGWLIRAIDAKWENMLPFQALSKSLIARNYAVIRFDNPGVKSPEFKCRELALTGNLANENLSRCFDISVLETLNVEKYVVSIEAVLLNIQRQLPKMNGKFVLVGFSEGIWHIATIIKRRKIDVLSVVAVGAPAESPTSLTKWQATDRVLEVLSEFDNDSDGVITNREIHDGYARGIGAITNNIKDWLSPFGFWTRNNRKYLEYKYKIFYEEILRQTKGGYASTKLNWIAQSNGLLVPDITDSFWNLHFWGRVEPGIELRKSGVPALFIWGGKDRQVRVPHQINIIKDDVDNGLFTYKIYDFRHHLLSIHSDTEWFGNDFADEIASVFDAYTKERLKEPNVTLK